MKKIKFDYRHIICCIITAGFLACIGVFFSKSIIRIIESARDLGLSIGYYFAELLELEHGIFPTVNLLPVNPTTPTIFLPETWEEFGVKWNEYWTIWASGDNFTLYFNWLCIFLSNILIYLQMIIILILIFFIIFKRSLNKKNNDYNKDTRPLTYFKIAVKYTYTPVKKWLVSFIDFVKTHKPYYIIWLIIWGINFNVFSIVAEAFAYYFYFIISFDCATIYRQVYKLILDLYVPIKTIPVFGWIIIAIALINLIRKKIAIARLNHYERKNRGFINSLPITSMDCGTMGSGKTTMITDMALSQEIMFRDKALEMLLEADLKFPNFPWINLENTLKHAMKKRLIYNLATIKVFINHLKYIFFESLDKDKSTKKAMRRYYKKTLKLNYSNFLFDYDYNTYGLYHDDKLKVVNVWEVIEDYAQLYFIYIIKSSLILSNYSIRTDNVQMDEGNFPLWNTDFMSRNSKYIDAISRHSHILDFDALRLGKKINEEGPFKDSFEFGIVVITEIGKERGNSIELQGKKKDDNVTNQKNDLFNYTIKMIRHSATINNYPFVKVLTDEQRPESWGADARDLCQIINIREKEDIRLAMPFFALEELTYSFCFNKFIDLYNKYRFNRGDNTLVMHLLKTITAKLQNHYKNTYNLYGYSLINADQERGTQDEQPKKLKYYLMPKKIYSNRYKTNSHGDFFIKKALMSAMGLDDIPEYQTEKATLEELKAQNSYFIKDITENIK